MEESVGGGFLWELGMGNLAIAAATAAVATRVASVMAAWVVPCDAAFPAALCRG